MSTLGEANRDAYRGSIDEGSAAPLMGFMDAMDASWQSATKVHSLLAVEQSMRTLEQEQIKKIREAGLRPPKSLDDSEDVGVGPFGGAQFRQGRYSAAAQSVVDGGGWYTDDLVAERNKEIETLRKERPDLGLMTYEEIFAKVREQSQDIEKRALGPTTLAGTIGGFIGGAAGAMNPVSDPVNAATMFVGGGAGAAERIALQGVAQMGVEAGNMALTPNNENILLDRRPTFGEDMARIGFAAAGGAGGQALGEAVAMGARRLTTGRWFNDVPPPEERIVRPEPPPEPIGEVPPPMAPGRPFNDYPDYETFRVAHKLDFEETYGKTRPAELRRALDLDHVATSLDRWDGPRPFEVEPPRTDVAFAREIADGVAYDRPYQKYIDNLDTVDDVARRIDPDLFRTYDKLAQQRDELRASIDRTAGPDTSREAARPDRAAAYADWQRATDQELRLKLQDVDYQMRDLAPLVTRAYSAAEKEWRSTPMDWNTMEFLKRLEDGTGFRYRGEGKPSLTEQPMRLTDIKTPAAPARTVDDTIPLARLTPDVEGKVKVNANADATERVRSNVADEVVVMDEKVETFLATVKEATKLDNMATKVFIDLAREKLAKAVEKDAKRGNQKLVVARKMPDGEVVMGEPGQIHAELLRDEDYANFHSGNEKDVNAQMGFALPDGTYLTRKEALDYVNKNEPELKYKGDTLEAFRYTTQGKKDGPSRLPPSPETRAAAEELDALENITFPNGNKLSLDNDRVPFVDANGNETQMTVRDFLREMQKDNDALKSVVTCSRPS